MKLAKGCRKRLERWIEALRSGEYRQGWGAMCRWNPRNKDPWEFCPLGVYYDVNVVDGEWRCVDPLVMEGSSSRLYELDNGASVMKATVCLDELDPALSDLAIDWNDNEHWTFAQIADELERRYLHAR